MGEIRGVNEFLILNNNAEDMVMRIYWYQSVTNGEVNDPNIRIFDMKNFGDFMQNTLEKGSEDALMDNDNVDIYLESNLKAWEKRHFNLDFLKLEPLKAIVREHGRTLFNPLIKKD